MAFLLDSSLYDDIRLALDTNLEADAIPDEIIEAVAYLPTAERYVLARDPLAASRTGVEKDARDRAIIYKTAALLSRMIPQIRQTNMAGHTATFVHAETAAERTSRLEAMASEELDTYLLTPVNLAANAPLFVTTVSGRRG